MAPRKDASAAASTREEPTAAAAASPTPAPPAQPTTVPLPVLSTSTVLNVAVHSLLMITVPFALFFTALLGGLDRELVGA